MAGKNGEDALPRPRFGWLAVFQIIIIALVVFMARETRLLSEPPMLEEQLGSLAESPGALARTPWGGRGWLAAVVAMVGALLLMLPVAWAYVEDVLESHTKRWELETDHPGPDNLPTLTYSIRLKKRTPPDALLQVLRERLGPQLAVYAPNQPGGNGTPKPDE